MEVVNLFKGGRKYYREGAWDKAIKAFGEALQLNPGDKLSNTYIERCEYLKAHPPEDWKGVWVMKEK
jgi:adenylate cyclase